MAEYFKGSENYSNKTETNEKVLNILNNLFGKSLHGDVIKSVGLNCHWDLNSASNILAEISNTVSNDHGGIKAKEKNSTGVNSRKHNSDVESKDVIENEIFDQDISNSTLLPENINKVYSPLKGREIFNQNINESRFVQDISKAFPRLKGMTSTDKKTNRSNTPPTGVLKPLKMQPKPVQNKSKRELEFDRIKKFIVTGAKVMVLLRGPPGSGKSHLARMLIDGTMQEDYRSFVFSTDDYFIINGAYQFNHVLVPEAHSWNHNRVHEVMQMGISPVVIDNTNTQLWEMRPYVHFAVKFGYAVEVLEPFTSWLYNPPELARRNIHNVPKAKIAEMLERYDRKITTDQLFAAYQLKYHPSKQPPQPRLYPPLRKTLPQKLDVRCDNSIPKIDAPKRKRLRKKKRDPSEIILSDSVSSIQSYEYCTSSESDEESSSKNNTVQDLLSTDISDCSEYVLVMPDNTRVYQKSYMDNVIKNEQNVDLINFNDADEAIKSNIFRDDLINLSTDTNVDKQTDRLDRTRSVMEHLSSVEVSEPRADTKPEKQKPAESGLYPKIDFSAWGLSENPLISWDIEKVPEQNDVKYNHPQPQRQVFKDMLPATMVDSNTNTCSSDFALIKRNCISVEEGKILNAHNRNINEYTLIAPPKPSLVTVFDKSTMTTENLLEPFTSQASPYSNMKNFAALLNLFPQTSADDLREIYDKCKGDVNWVVDLLLDSNLESVSNKCTLEPDTTNETDRTLGSTECTSYEIQSLETEQTASETSEDSSKMASVESKKINRFKSKLPLSEESLELKRQIEEHVKINDVHYSEYLLNLRRKKHGEAFPSTSSIILTNEVSELSTETVIQDAYSEDEEENKEVMEVNVGMEFVEQLEQSLGFGKVDYPEGLQPVMQLPTSILKQLHAYWLESVCQQMEAYSNILEQMVHEDEELARRLQQEEESAADSKEPVVPDLQEIMDMEIALAVYQADQKQWKAETPDDLATRMKRQKLIETFPDLDSSTLVEILQAHDNSFEQTVEVLMSSVGNTFVRIDKTGIQELQKQKELIENAKKEYLHAKQELNIEDEDSEAVEEDDCCCAEKTANDYREEAAHHLKMRHICFNKAQTALQKKWTQVATYYSDMAKLHKQKFEQANSRAASAFLTSHYHNHQNSNTLDLHYLYVKEAEEALAVYLDSQISKLKETNKPKDSIFIITGRGKRSRKGISQIKPAVERKLRERILDYAEVNPGLLKVRITRHSIMTNDVKN